MRFLPIILLLLTATSSVAQSNWARRVGAWSNDAFNAIVIDGSGNTYVTGEFGGSIQVGTGTIVSQGSLDIMVAKYAPNGAPIWVRSFGGTGLDKGIDLALGPAGELVVTGVFMGTVVIDGTTLTSAGGTMDMFVMRMSSADGSVLWARQGGGPTGADQPNSISVGPDGAIAITGEFVGTAVFDGGTITSMIDPNTGLSSMDIFVQTYDISGNSLWLKHGTAKHADRGMSVVHDLAGNVYVGGQFSDTITFDNTHFNSMYSAVFLVRFNASGSEEWFRVFGGGTYNQLFDMEVIGNDRLMLVGDVQGTVIFLDSQPNLFTAVAPRSSFLVELDLQGEFTRQTTWGSDHVVNTRSLSIKENEVIVLGRFQCQFTGFSSNTGSGTWLATGQHDLYVARFELDDLVLKDAQQFGGQGNKVPGGIVHSPAAAPIFCGSFASLLVFPSQPGQFQAIPQPLNFNVPNVQGTFCDDPYYNSYTGLRGSALMDAFIAQGFTEGRQPYDIFARPGGDCERPQRDIFITLNGQGVAGPDSASVCHQGWLGVQTHTAYNPDTAIKHTAPDLEFLWNTGATGTVLQVTTTGWYSVTVTSSAGCWARNDSLYVRVDPLPAAVLISDDVVVNTESPSPYVISACEPLTPMLWVTGVDPANTITWSTPNGSFPGPSI